MALERNLYSSEEINLLTEQDILMIIFKDGFSTNDNITDISGRGVGLASVLYELNKLDGVMKIENSYGNGIKFSFTIPLEVNIYKEEKYFLRQLVNRTIDYYKEELSLEIDRNFEIISVDEFCFEDITTLISLSGDMTGTVGMSVSNNLAFKMVKSFLFEGMPKEELDELKVENVAETLNITLGNILQELHILLDGGKIEISTPKILSKQLCVKNKEYKNKFLCKLKIDKEIIILSYLI